MALTTRLSLSLLATLTDALDLSTATDRLDYLKNIELATGTAANQSDMLWHDRRTLSASATENLDFAASLTNGLGDTQTFARIKAFIVYAATGNTNNVNVIREGTNGVPLFLAAGDGIAVRPGGLFVAVAPDATAYAVTASTGDLVTFTNSAGSTSVTYDVIVIGASA
jgi:hypothetical protein